MAAHNNIYRSKGQFLDKLQNLNFNDTKTEY